VSKKNVYKNFKSITPNNINPPQATIEAAPHVHFAKVKPAVPPVHWVRKDAVFAQLVLQHSLKLVHISLKIFPGTVENACAVDSSTHFLSKP